MSTLLLAACSAGNDGIGAVGSLGLPASVPYQHSNAIAPAGFRESQLAPNQYRIEVTGSANASQARLEKIAATRAAEIGRDNRLRYFKLDNLQHTTRCTPKRSTYRGGGHGELNYRVLTADVAYAPTPPDATYLESRRAFDQLRAELDLPEAPSETAPFACPG
ncbi:hypothetical protein W911_08300 [Hyphomicrobium nitrativorans NL23]|uniref:Uncharacterized protein n=1 Tax=Hyphomicrobium nitrativorans NL23 TaxID=1029756 RepID=V5SHY5_9HYPH|nr:hypothetical protein [Hyphomicrobium nitrativorans]AHB50112.1 hypothetical protein W911_08300 [Hyphomicrobium nitrativorans NL23]